MENMVVCDSNGTFVRQSFDSPTDTFEGQESTGILSRPKNNSTLTYLRLGTDGGLRAYRYDPIVDWGGWEETYTLFTRISGEECQLPERCGEFGLCEESQCAGCPSPNGLLGWSKSCAPPKLTTCRPSDVKYYKLEGVDHCISKFTHCRT